MLFAGILNSVSVFVKPLATYYKWSTDAIANVSTTMLFIWTPGALLGGWLMRFSSMNTLTLKDLPDEQASSGNSLLSMVMQLSMVLPFAVPWIRHIGFTIAGNIAKPPDNRHR